MENYTFKPSVRDENDNSSIPIIKSNYEEYTSNQTHTVGLKYNNLIPTDSDFTELEDKYKNQDITGVNIPNLVIKSENTDNDNKEISNEIFDVSNLITDQPVKFNETKFGVNAIPINQDRTMLPDANRYEAIVESINSQLIKATEKPEFVTKKTTSWISRLIDNKGEDYITSGKLSIDEVSRNAERIIDDIIAGRIDYTKFGKYIIMPVFIETLINYCTNKLAINKAIQYSLGYVYNDYTNRYGINPNDYERINSLMTINDNLSRNITQAIAIVNQDIAIYGAIYNKLQYVQSTKNASSLFNLATELNAARKQTRKRY